MDDEIEDIVGDVKYTDSQKSMTTRSSQEYSPDFTDCSSSQSDKHNSTGKETYVIECDSEDSEQIFPIHMCRSTFNNSDINSNSLGASSEAITVMSVQCGPSHTITKCASTSYHTMSSMIAQETYTQTSKTIIEIAETEGNMRRIMDTNSLETQTSRVSITENKTVEYRIEVSSVHDHFTKTDVIGDYTQTVLQLNDNVFKNQQNMQPLCEIYDNESCPPQKPNQPKLTSRKFYHAPLDDNSSKFQLKEIDNDGTNIENVYRSDDESSRESSDDEIIRIINDDSSNTDLTDDDQTLHIHNSDSLESSVADIEEDSLMEERPNSDNKDVRELHEILSENEENLCLGERYADPDIRRFGTLTPLTEEANTKKDSLQDISTTRQNTSIEDANPDQEEVLFRSAAGVKVKVLRDDDAAKNSFKLPPIKNNSCPNSPHLNSLFGKPKLFKAGTLPSLHEKHGTTDRWEIANKNLAAGESPLISERSKTESPRKPNGSIQLPPIRGEAIIVSREEKTPSEPAPPLPVEAKEPCNNHDPISIGQKIKELKLSATRSRTQRNTSHSRVQSPSISPDASEHARAWHDEGREIVDRGCEAVCVDLLRRLRSSTWFEVIETLEELPKELSKFWEVITETRIADLLRQVNIHVESPRPQVAKTACGTVAAIVKNTGYTRKPDFYETVTTLLIKTGSYSRVVRRAANLALDHIVCGVDMTHAVTALCIHGVGHKNALVRCAAARLLVVCCALAGGGRGLLRTRPASAATARRHVLRALALLLDDKSTDTRKYAERLYSMLRPLSNFEAYYLTDVEVELASKQMKKYDQVLCGPLKESGR